MLLTGAHVAQKVRTTVLEARLDCFRKASRSVIRLSAILVAQARCKQLQPVRCGWSHLPALPISVIIAVVHPLHLPVDIPVDSSFARDQVDVMEKSVLQMASSASTWQCPSNSEARSSRTAPTQSSCWQRGSLHAS